MIHNQVWYNYSIHVIINFKTKQVLQVTFRLNELFYRK